MHVRLSACRGSPVYERDGDAVLGVLSGLLIQPDTGAIEGVFVEVPHMLRREERFCPSLDIVHWGASLEVRSADSVADPAEHIRLQSLFEDGRTILGQRIRTEAGRSLGRCADVQFDTERMHVEWLFPRRFTRWGVALPLRDILEVRRDVIIVRDPALPASESTLPLQPAVSLDVLGEIAETRVPRPSVCTSAGRKP